MPDRPSFSFVDDIEVPKDRDEKEMTNIPVLLLSR